MAEDNTPVNIKTAVTNLFQAVKMPIIYFGAGYLLAVILAARKKTSV